MRRAFIVFIFGVLALSVVPPPVEAWADNDFLYAKGYVTSNTSVLDNDQIAINITLNSSVVDFNYMCIYANDNTTRLDYWIETSSGTDWAYTWIETSQDTVWIYFGNTTTSSCSPDFDETLICGDEFVGNSLNTTRWHNMTESFSVVDGILNTSIAAAIIYISQDECNYTDAIVESRTLVDSGARGQVTVRFNSTQVCARLDWNDGYTFNYRNPNDDMRNQKGASCAATSTLNSTAYSAYSEYKRATAITNGSFIQFEMEDYDDGSNYDEITATDSDYSCGSIALSTGGMASGYAHWDWVFARTNINPMYTSTGGSIENQEVEPSSEFSVALNNPGDGSQNTTTLTIQFDFTVTVTNTTMINCSLWTNESGWSDKEINTTPINGGSITSISETFSSEGSYLWNVECYNETASKFAASNYTINIELSPTVTLTSPGDEATAPVPVDFVFAAGNGPFYGAELWINASGTEEFPSPDNGYTSWDSYKFGSNQDNIIISVGAGGEWDDNRVLHPWMDRVENDSRLYYSGHDGSTMRIGLANGTSWDSLTKWPGNPIFSESGSGNWDDNGIRAFRILDNCTGDGTTCAYYSGNDGTTDRIGLATSNDNVTWTRYPVNKCSGTSGDGCIIDVCSPGEWCDYRLDMPAPKKIGDIIQMLFRGAPGSGTADWAIGYANSTDGINFTLYDGNPVISKNVSSDWYCYSVSPSGILDYVNGTYHASIFGKDDSCGETEPYSEAMTSDIGYMSSTDMMSWIVYPDHILTNERAWEVAEVELSSGQEIDGVYYIYYDSYGSSPWSIGGINISLNETAGGWQMASTNASVVAEGSNTITYNFSGYEYPSTIVWNINLTDDDGDSAFAASNFTVNINDYEIPSDTENYNSLVYETTDQTIRVNFTTVVNTEITAIYAELIYNSTNFGYDVNNVYLDGSDVYEFITTVDVPLIQENATSRSFYWNYTITYQDGNNFTYTTDTHVQTIMLAYWPVSITADASLVTEGTNVTFTVDIEDRGDATYNVSVWFDETEYDTSLSGSDYVSVISTTGANDTSFYNGSMLITWGADSIIRNTTTGTLLIYEIVLTNCSADSESQTETLHFYIRDEDTGSLLTGDLDIAFDVWVDPAATYNFSWGFNDSNNYSVCIYPTWASYWVDSISEYSATGYSQRTYYLANASVSNTTQDIDLFLKENTTTTLVTMTVYNALGFAEEDVYINVQRYHIDTNTYSTVAILRTDFAGQASAYLTLYDVWYRFILSQDGEVLESYSPTILTEDEIIFRLTEGGLGEWFDYYDNLAHNCTWPGNTTTCTVTDSSGLMAESTLDVKRWTSLGYVDVCSSTSTSSSVTHVCDMGVLTGRLFWYELTVDMDATETSLESGYVDNRTATNYGNVGVMATLLLMMVFIFIGSYRWEISLAFCAASIAVSSLMGILLISYGSVVAAFVVVGIAIYKTRST